MKLLVSKFFYKEMEVEKFRGSGLKIIVKSL